MSNKKDFLVGLVFIGAIVGIGYLTIMIKGFSVLTRPHITPLTITFPEIVGLQEGEEVRVKGVEIGQVEKITYQLHGNVEVVITLFKRPGLRKGCKFYIRSKSPLGGKFLEIDPGPFANPYIDITKNNHFTGERPTDLYSELGKLIGKKRKSIEEIIDNVNNVTETLVKGEGPLGMLLYNKQLKNDLIEIVSGIKDSITGKKKGLLYTIMSDPEVAKRFRSLVIDLDKNLQDKNTPIGVLLNDAQTGKNLQSVLADTAQLTGDIRKGKGTFGKLLTDDQLYSKTTKFVDDLSLITNGNGLAANLIKNPEWRDKGEEILNAIRNTMVRIDSGEGTLGKLLSKSKIYDDLENLLVQLRESVEDAREQAPVTQLVNMLGAAF